MGEFSDQYPVLPSGGYYAMDEASWPKLPMPYLRARVHPAQYPGQQFVDIKICRNQGNTVPPNKTSTASENLASSVTTSKIILKKKVASCHSTSKTVLKENASSSCKTSKTVSNDNAASSHAAPSNFALSNKFRIACHSNPGFKKNIPNVDIMNCNAIQKSKSNSRKPNENVTDIVLTNRFTALEIEECNNDGDVGNYTSDNHVMNQVSYACQSKPKKKTSAYVTVVPLKKVTNKARVDTRSHWSPIFSNPYRVSSFSMLTYHKSGFTRTDVSLCASESNARKIYFTFDIVPHFLQSLNLSISDPLVCKLLSHYGVKMADYRHQQLEMPSASSIYAGSLLGYLLKLLLGKSCPSLVTFERVIQLTGKCLCGYQELYGDRFNEHVDVTRAFNKSTDYLYDIKNIPKNYFDIKLLLLCGDIESNPGPRRKTSTLSKINRFQNTNQTEYGNYHMMSSVICGNFHQGDSNRFSILSVGKQCVCNAMIALCILPMTKNVTPATLDIILSQGDEWYNAIQTEIRPSQQYQYLETCQLPNKFSYENVQYSIKQHNPYFASKKNLYKSSGIYDSLDDCIQKALAISNNVLLVVGEYAISLFLKDCTYNLFDSHSRSNLGEVTDDGHSVLLSFSTFDNLLVYFERLVDSLCSDQHHIIQSVPVTITKDCIDWLKKYIENQNDLQKQKMEAKRAYNRAYKQNQRKTVNFRAAEKHTELHAKRQKRQDPDFKHTELKSKQQKRKNPDFKHSELKSKQQKRQDPVFRHAERQNELVSKQKRRENEFYKTCE